MSYCTPSDLVEAFGEQLLIDLTDRADPPSGVVDTVALGRAIADADAEIDGYLGVKYTVPLTPTPDRVRAVSCDLVRYRLTQNKVSEQVRARYEDAVRWLRDVAAGRAVIPGAEQPVAGGGGNLAQVSGSPRRLFGGGLL